MVVEENPIKAKLIWRRWCLLLSALNYSSNLFLTLSIILSDERWCWNSSNPTKHNFKTALWLVGKVSNNIGDFLHHSNSHWVIRTFFLTLDVRVCWQNSFFFFNFYLLISAVKTSFTPYFNIESTSKLSHQNSVLDSFELIFKYASYKYL